MKKVIVLAVVTTVVGFPAEAGWKTNAVGGLTGFLARDFAKSCLRDAACRARGLELAIAGATKIVQKYGGTAVQTCLATPACTDTLMRAIASGSDQVEALAGSKAIPGPPGDCGPDEFGGLNLRMEQSCKGFKKGELSCKSTDSLQDLEDKLDRVGECADARKRRENICFRGGDRGHRVQIGQMMDIMSNCGKFIMKRAGKG
jgi:hypothetical protein